MHLLAVCSILSLLPFAHGAETILGVYIFSRHGDRTAKATPPSNLTDLGYQEVFTSGTYYRNRYIASAASHKVAGLNTDLVKLSQIAASAPLDNVLMPSAQGFLQGLYPPVGSDLGSETLRNQTVIQAPLNGYQLIPISTVSTGTGSEDSAWLQGSSNCARASVSSNEYLTSPDFTALSNSTKAFYQSVAPMVNATLSSTDITFKDAYTIFDLLNVASIHNATFPSSNLLTNDTFFQLRTLADVHEFNLAYNDSDPIRAIAGATLAAQVVQSLNQTITSGGKGPKMAIQFGAYGSFQSFFGLANLTSSPYTDPGNMFFGIPDYASTMVFELFSTVSSAHSSFPAPTDLQVRFLFHNGTTSNTSEPTAYPLFGSGKTELGWNDFLNGMNKFAIGNQSQWCQACGNSTGVCAAASMSNGSGSTQGPCSSSAGGDGGVSKPVAGVIGAMVTLAVILGAEALIMLLAGLRLVKKNRLGNGSATNGSGAAGPTTGNGNNKA